MTDHVGHSVRRQRSRPRRWSATYSSRKRRAGSLSKAWSPNSIRRRAARFGRLAGSGELTGKTLEMTLLHFVPGLAAQRVLLVGAGKREKFGTAELRRLAAAAVRYLKARSVKRIAFLAREGDRGRRRRRKPSPKDCCSATSTATSTARTRRTARWNRPSLVGFDAARASRRRSRTHHRRIAELRARTWATSRRTC